MKRPKRTGRVIPAKGHLRRSRKARSEQAQIATRLSAESPTAAGVDLCLSGGPERATDGGVETTQYPLSIYEPWFRKVFTYVVPLGCVSYFPALAIMGRPYYERFGIEIEVRK